MVTPYKVHSLSQLAQDLDAALTWFRSVGISQVGRFNDQRRVVEQLATAYPRYGRETWTREFRDSEARDRAADILAEAIETDQIVEELRQLTDVTLLMPALRLWVKGPASPWDERAANASNRGRDFGFELLMYALLHRGGLDPNYVEPDVTAQTARRLCLVACKRPQTEAAIPRRFDEGCDQIRRELAKAAATGQPAPCGVVALSFNKLMGRSVLVFQQKEAYFDKIAVVIDKLVPTWRARQGIELAGVLCHVLLPAFDDENGRFVHMHFSAPVPTPGGGASGDQAFVEVVRSMDFDEIGEQAPYPA